MHPREEGASFNGMPRPYGLSSPVRLYFHIWAYSQRARSSVRVFGFFPQYECELEERDVTLFRTSPNKHVLSS